MRDSVRIGALAGLAAGLALAGREIALMEEQKRWLSEPLTYLPWPSLTILLYALLGAAVGTATGLILFAAMRGRPDDDMLTVGAWLAPLAVGVLVVVRGALFAESPFGGWPGLVSAVLIVGGILFAALRRRPDDDVLTPRAWLALLAACVLVLVRSALFAESPFDGWSELVSLALITTGVLMALHRRIGQVAPNRLASAAVAVLAGELTFFLMADQIWDMETMALALRYVLLVVTVLPAALAGCLAWRLLAWVMDLVARRASERAAVAGVTALVALPLVIFGIAGLIQLSASPESDLSAVAASSPQSDPSRPNVILISIDTLRADFVGYAGGPARTPNIDALAAASYVLENAYSVAPWTRPSFASFFSSRYPAEMGVARVRGVGGEEWGAPIPHQWREDRPLLAEVLQDAGYYTAAVVTNHNLTVEARADQGFALFQHCSCPSRTSWADKHLPLFSAIEGLFPAVRPSTDGNELERASVVSTAAMKAISQINTPMLLWLHYMDPHQPYDAPDAPTEAQVIPGWAAGAAGKRGRSAEERNAFLTAHVFEIEYCDSQLGQIMDYLRRTDLWESSIVVFWSDHGEEFWEHGHWEHGHTLFNELLHIPLVIHLPGQSGSHRIEERVSLLDVMPTLLELCGIHAPEDMRGRSLTPLLAGRTGNLPPFRVFAEACVYGGMRKGLMTDHYKLIYHLYGDEFSLYDLQTDPGEQHNIYGTPLAPDTTQMERELLAWTEESLAMMDEYVAKAGAEDIPPEVRERLRDMGYIQ